ncbi:DNA cytosine methyltransferase [Anaerovibrio sp.]|uniref:DNA cytosine methyltransferase n=1 Tax=Anaerovibrio sp. TaxID=1872532 RepID=UPI003890AA33
MSKINTIDLFAGCGGLTDGFAQTGLYNTVAAVEWEKAPCANLRERLKSKWGYDDSASRVIRFDIQRTEELFNGWSDDDEYGSSVGLDNLVNKVGKIDVIIGGPPCQAYSIAGRVSDANGMRDDYRNYLFESYLKVVSKYKPKLFVFENVPGILSAKPGNRKIIDVIQEAFEKVGYHVLTDLKNAIMDFSDYGVPQNRKRIIIVGLRKEYWGENLCESILQNFYNNILSKYKVEKKATVKEAIGDLPKLCPLKKEIVYEGRKTIYNLPEPFVPNHVARWQSERDRDIFKILTTDIESGRNQYISTAALKELYTQKTGHVSNVHKYYVLRWDEPSNLIPAHLYKDGLRHIHPDSKQVRSITVREAARLQSFDDDYIFKGSNQEVYKMIGNAVPPLFAKKLAMAIYDFLKGKK